MTTTKNPHPFVSLFKPLIGKNCKILNFFGIQSLLLPLSIMLANTRILQMEALEKNNSHTFLTPSSHWMLVVE